MSPASKYRSQKQHHSTALPFHQPHTENTERQSNIEGQSIVVRDILTHT